MGRRPTSGVYPLALVDGGLNTRGGQVALSANQTRKMKNVTLNLQGGFTKSPGFTEVTRLSFPIQELMLYQKDDNNYEVIAYNQPELTRVDVLSGGTTVLKNNILNVGTPQYAQDNNKRMHIVDGKNDPIFYNGNTITTITWPPSYGATNSSQLSSIFARDANPASTAWGKPTDCAFYAGRMVYIEDKLMGVVAYSKAGDTTDFSTNSGAPVPIDVAFFERYITKGPFTAIQPIFGGLMLYTKEGIGRITGKNAPTPGLDNQITFEWINDKIGALSPNMVTPKSNNEHFVYSRYGLFEVTLSEEGQQTRPGELSYDIQEDLDAIGSGGMSRGKLVNAPHDGYLVMLTPRKRTHLWLDKIWKYNYEVGRRANPQTTPWSADEFFGGSPNRFDAMLVVPPKNDIYIAVYDTIYKWSGTAYLNSSAIQSEYEFPPNDFGWPGVNKQASAYHIIYKSTTGATIKLEHSWDNGQSGSTDITLPRQTADQLGTAVFGTATYTSNAAFQGGAFRVPVSGGTVGKNMVVNFVHRSASEDITIYYIGIEWNVWGIGA